LNNYILKVVPRSLQKGDTVYTSSLVKGGYQCTVQCPCLPNSLAEAKFAGEVCAAERDAEHSAAGFALAAIKEDPELTALYDGWQSREERLGLEPKLGPDGEPLPKRQKKAREDNDVSVIVRDTGDHSSDYTPKQLLNNAVIKIVPRSIKRGEIDYKTQEVEGGYQAQLTIHCLPTDMATAVFAGPVCSSEKEGYTVLHR